MDLDYDFVEINNIDDFDDYYLGFDKCIRDLSKEYKIFIDHTSGTKTMSMAAAIAALVYNKDLYVIEGERKNGAIIKGTETVKQQNLYLAYDKMIIDKVKEFFNNNRFDSGLDLLEVVSDPKINKDVYKQMFKAYSFFDKVNHKEALDNFNSKLFVDEFPNLKGKLQLNIKALNIINTEHKLKYVYTLASIFNNADRRMTEFKYDDAIARLYRSFELIAQIRLYDEYGVDSSDVFLDDLDVDSTYLEDLKLKVRDGKIKLGLVDDYVLLYNLGDSLGEFFMDNARLILDKIKLRNTSILAHGLNYTSGEEYNSFRDIVYKAACILDGDFDTYLSETKFPVF